MCPKEGLKLISSENDSGFGLKSPDSAHQIPTMKFFRHFIFIRLHDHGCFGACGGPSQF